MKKKKARQLHELLTLNKGKMFCWLKKIDYNLIALCTVIILFVLRNIDVVCVSALRIWRKIMNSFNDACRVSDPYFLPKYIVNAIFMVLI